MSRSRVTGGKILPENPPAYPCENQKALSFSPLTSITTMINCQLYNILIRQPPLHIGIHSENAAVIRPRKVAPPISRRMNRRTQGYRRDILRNRILICSTET